MQKMSKEEFIEILSRQQRSGLTIKDFCINEAYTESSFYYWKGKFGLSRRYHMDRHSSSLEEFAPVSLTSSPASHSACYFLYIVPRQLRFAPFIYHLRTTKHYHYAMLPLL